MTHDKYKAALDALDKYMLINDKINFQSYNFQQKHAVQFLEFYKEQVCSALQLAQEAEQLRLKLSETVIHLAARNTQIEELKAKLDKAKDALTDIAQFYDGEIVTGSFDEPHSALKARNCLNEIF